MAASRFLTPPAGAVGEQFPTGPGIFIASDTRKIVVLPLPCYQESATGLKWTNLDGNNGSRLIRTANEHKGRGEKGATMIILLSGEPYETLIRERGYLPNPVSRYCTTMLKIEVMRDYTRSFFFCYLLTSFTSYSTKTNGFTA